MKTHNWAFVGSYTSSTLFPRYINLWCACRDCGRGRDFYVEPNAQLQLPQKDEDAYGLFNDLERLSDEDYVILWTDKSGWKSELDYKRLSLGSLREETCPAKTFIGKIRA